MLTWNPLTPKILQWPNSIICWISDINDVLSISNSFFSGDPGGCLPYSSIYNYKKFKSYYRNVFIPGAEITATITDYERSATTHIINPNL